MMKPLSLLYLFLTSAFVLAGCVQVTQTVEPTLGHQIQSIITPSATAPINSIVLATPTGIVSMPSDTPLSTITLTPFDTLEPAQARETLQPLTKDPMNCAVPCFWGIIPGKTLLDEVRVSFSRLGFITKEGKGFYSVGYKPDSGDGFSTIFYTSGTIVDSIIVTPYVSEQTKVGSPRKWIAYSPETLIKRYGKPSRVQFAVDSQQNVAIEMIMYFDASDLIVYYSGYNMTPEWFCPLTAPFDSVRLWIGPNPRNPPSFETISLEKATSITTEQFAQLLLGDPKKACFTIKSNVSP